MLNFSNLKKDLNLNIAEIQSKLFAGNIEEVISDLNAIKDKLNNGEVDFKINIDFDKQSSLKLGNSLPSKGLFF